MVNLILEVSLEMLNIPSYSLPLWCSFPVSLADFSPCHNGICMDSGDIASVQICVYNLLAMWSQGSDLTSKPDLDSSSIKCGYSHKQYRKCRFLLSTW